MTLTTLNSGQSKHCLRPALGESLAYKLYTAEQVREAEPIAAQLANCTMFELMQRAGKSVFELLMANYPMESKILVIVGHGNNGGDGYVLARLARLAKLDVTLCSVQKDKSLEGDALMAQIQWLESGGTIEPWERCKFADYDVLVDGLLGTGLRGPVKTLFKAPIDAINQSNLPVISIDVPSGLNADTGQAMGCAVKASHTLSFVGKKCGLLTGQGKHYSGDLQFSSLGINLEFMQSVSACAQLISYAALEPLPQRANHAHKGNFGKLLCIGGNQGMTGAIRLCSEAALRCGAGMVKSFCHSKSTLAVGAGRPELMVVSDDLSTHLRWSTCLVLGPGLAQNEWGRQHYAAALLHVKASACPLVMDADALNLFAKDQAAKLANVAWVMTPHPAEAARLLGLSTEEIEQDRYLAAHRLATKYQCVCVLKGAGTIISDGHSSFVCQDGNPGMATAGMGDVLSGVIGALLAQGICPLSAAIYGVCLHARAGDLEAEKSGQRGILASDLFLTLKTLVNFHE